MAKNIRGARDRIYPSWGSPPAWKNKATKKPGMTSIPGFRNCPGGGTQGRGEPQHDIMGRFRVRMADAGGRKIWEKQPWEGPSRIFSEVHEGRRGEARGGAPPQAHQLFAFHDLNLAGGGLFGFLAGDLDAQHAILVGRGDLVGFDVFRQGEHAAERAV